MSDMDERTITGLDRGMCASDPPSPMKRYDPLTDVTALRQQVDDLTNRLENMQDSPATGDMAFINHIQQHLGLDEEVVCKICGKTAREIMGEEVE